MDVNLIRKIKMEVGDTVNLQALESPVVDDAAVILDLVEASARRSAEPPLARAGQRAEPRVVPYAE